MWPNDLIFSFSCFVVDGFLSLSADVDGISCCFASKDSTLPTGFPSSFWRFFIRSLNETFKFVRWIPAAAVVVVSLDTLDWWSLMVGEVGLRLAFREPCDDTLNCIAWNLSFIDFIQINFKWVSLTLDCWLSLELFSSLAFSNFSRCSNGKPAPITSGSGSSWIEACGDMVDETCECVGGETTGVMCFTARSSRSYICHVQTRLTEKKIKKNKRGEFVLFYRHLVVVGGRNK